MIKHLRKRVMRTGRPRAQGRAWVISRERSALRVLCGQGQQEALS
jgi:hypothetical protein